MSLDEARQRDMKIARKYGKYRDLYEVDGELYGTVGSDLATYFAIGPAYELTIEQVPHFSFDKFAVRWVEKLITRSGQWEEYVQILEAAGASLKDATIEQRCEAVLELPYSPPPPPEEPIVEEPPVTPVFEAEPEDVSASAEAEVQKPAEAEQTHERAELPDDWWLTYVDGEHVPVIFEDKNGEVEKVEAIYRPADNLFKLMQTPLRVNGVSLYDYVEVRWEQGDLTPIFVRLDERDGYGTVRVNVKMLSRKARRILMDSLYSEMVGPRFDDGTLVFTYWGYHYHEVVYNLDRQGLDWEFADEFRPGDLENPY